MDYHFFKRKLLFSIFFSFLFMSVSAQIPTYYNGTNITNTGQELKTNLAKLIQKGTSGSYTPGVWDALKQTDLDPNNSNNVLLIYGYNDTDRDSKTDRTRSKNNNGGNSGTDWNREHTYPRSLGSPNLGSSGPGSDVHHLRSSDVNMNSNRGNKPFIDAAGGGNARAFNNGWYPGDEWKGDVARMMMYMYLRYENQCKLTTVGVGSTTYNSEIPDIFLEWNVVDPVSQYEINRNVIVEGIQGNRNPFIDNPAFATSIWGGPQAQNRFNNANPDNEAPTAPENLIAFNTSSSETTLSWDASLDNIGVIAYRIFQDGNQIASVSNTNYMVTGLSEETTYSFKVNAIDASSNSSADSNIINATTLKGTTTPPTNNDFITFQGFEGADSWNYSVSPVLCSDGGNDVWDVVSTVGSINAPETGLSFFGVRDLEGNCGTSAGGSISFDNVAISDYENVQLSFSVNVVGYDVSNGDTISYQMVFDEQVQNEEIITIGSPYSTNDWEKITVDVPNTVTTVGFIINVKQNGGSDYAGFDAVGLSGTLIAKAEIVINELDADTSGTDTLEFVELYDGGTGNTSLDGHVLVFYNGSNNESYRTVDLSGEKTNAEGYFVIGNKDVPNVGIIIPSNGLQNGADAVGLYSGNVSDFPNGSSVTVTNLLDAVVYDTNDSDDVDLLILLNAGEPQLNENEEGDKDTHSLQRSPNGLGGARNTSSFKLLLPTPGVANADVVTEPTKIITIDEARNKVDGEKVFITGVLTVTDAFKGSAYIQDSTGAIAIFDNQVYGDNLFKIGDSITVKGTRSSFRDQIQLNKITEIVNNGVANNPIIPKVVTLENLINYPGQLVKVLNPIFPKPKDILFGNSNYELSDSSGSGLLRIDIDASDLVGLGQPENCSQVIGVVGRFFNTYQLLPRQGSDLSCALTYVPPVFPINNISKKNTLDIVTWNIEWFGDEENSPAAGNVNSDQIQKENVKAVLNKLDADIIAVQEIVDLKLFDELLSELPEYDYIFSDAVSRPNATDGISQKVGFIYKKATVKVKKTEALLKSIHPLYNGGDDSALLDYPNADRSRFYASGRLPFLMTADVTINGETEEYNFVALHARANNNGDAQNRYNMRKYDVEVLKDSLDANFSNTNLVLLGDYNDDVDETVVSDLVTDNASTYDLYIKDTENYSIATKSLTSNGFRSYVFVENMIDHITISNELDDNYLSNSERVHYEFYNNTYSRTTSDHFPVSIRLQLKELELNVTSTSVTCNASADGEATVSVSNGVAPYTYLWSNGAATATVSELNAGTYNVTVRDAVGVSITQNFIIKEPSKIEASVSDTVTVYNGLDSESCAKIEVLSISGGSAPYSYEWSNGETLKSINVCPKENTIYTVIITDANECSVSKEVTVKVIDVLCDKSSRFKKIQMCFKGKSKCIPEFLVKHYLRKGAVLGSCNVDNGLTITKMRLYPNPLFRKTLTIGVESNNDSTADISIYKLYGGYKVFSSKENIVKGSNTFKYNLANLRRGVYYVKTFVDGKRQQVKILIKH